MIIEQADKRRLTAEEEQFKIRQIERERIDQILSALQMQIEALQQFQRSIIGDHDILNRLDLSLGTLQREIEDAIRRDEAMTQRVSVVEEWVPRTGQLMTEVHQLGDRLRQERADAAEAARRAEQSRARHMAEWAEQMKTSRREIEEWLAQMRAIQEKYKDDRKIVPAMQELEERLKQTEARLLQWQRLVEETRRKEREQLVADIEKRWQQQLGEWQFLRDEWNKRMAVISDRVTKLEDWRPEVAAQLHDLVEKMDKERRERAGMILTVIKVMSEIEHKRNAGIDKMLDDLLARFEGEKVATKSRKAPAGG
jgi:chromosome segregation ATPase